MDPAFYLYVIVFALIIIVYVIGLTYAIRRFTRPMVTQANGFLEALQSGSADAARDILHGEPPAMVDQLATQLAQAGATWKVYRRKRNFNSGYVGIWVKTQDKKQTRYRLYMQRYDGEWLLHDIKR